MSAAAYSIAQHSSRGQQPQAAPRAQRTDGCLPLVHIGTAAAARHRHQPAAGHHGGVGDYGGPKRAAAAVRCCGPRLLLNAQKRELSAGCL